MASIIRPEPGKGKKPKTDEARSRGGKELPPVRGKKPKTDKERSRRGNELQPVYKRDKRGQKQKTGGLKSVKARTINTMNKTKPAQPNRRDGR